MNNGTSLRELIDNPEIKSLLSDLAQLVETPFSIEDINGNLLLGSSLTSSADEYLITVAQQTIGLVKGNPSVQVLARLLSYLVLT